MVRVVSAVPHYPSGRVPPAFRGSRVQHSHEGGVMVTRVGLPSVDRSRLGLRLAQFAAYQAGAVFAARRFDYEILLTVTPALEVWLPFMALGRFRRRPAIYSVHDLYPEVGIQTGVFRNAALAGLVGRLEQNCLQGAQRVRILAPGFRERLLARGVLPDRMCLIYDWVDTDFIQPLSRQNAFARNHGLDDGRFIVLYAGNIGLTHGLGNLLQAAELLTGYPEIRFVLVGDGGAKAGLVRQAQKRGLLNVLFLPYQPRERLPEVLACADLGVVSLGGNQGQASLPSKLFSIMASGRPVLACVEADTDTSRLVREAGCGVVVEPGDAMELAGSIQKLHAAERLRWQMGQQGRVFAMQNHSITAATLAFEQLFSEAVETYQR